MQRCAPDCAGIRRSAGPGKLLLHPDQRPAYLTRYHGVLAPRSALRAEITPAWLAGRSFRTLRTTHGRESRAKLNYASLALIQINYIQVMVFGIERQDEERPQSCLQGTSCLSHSRFLQKPLRRTE